MYLLETQVDYVEKYLLGAGQNTLTGRIWLADHTLPSLKPSGSQPFGLQVPVKDKCLGYCTSQFFKYCVPELCVLWTQKHQIDAELA